MTDPALALAWLRVERANIEAWLDHAAAQDDLERMVALGTSLTCLLRTDGPWPHAINVHTATAAAAGRLEGRRRQAKALTELGVVHLLTGDYPSAATNLRQAERLYQELDDRHGQADAATQQGAERALSGDYPGATGHLHTALSLYRQVGDRTGQTGVLGLLGSVLWAAGDRTTAIRSLDEAAELFQDLGNRRGQAGQLTQVAAARQRIGDTAGAIRNLDAALTVCRNVGPRRLTNTLTWLGSLWRVIGTLPGLPRQLEVTLEMFRKVNSHGGEASALNHYASVFAALGDVPRALALYREALPLTRQVRQPTDETVALEGIGECLISQGRTQNGAVHLRRALEIHYRLGNTPEAERIHTRLTELGAR